MMKTIAKIALPMVLMTACGFADDMGGNKAAQNPQMPMFNEYNNRMVVFYPNHVAYERTKNDAFYVGIEGWLTCAYTSSNKHNPSHPIVGQGEFRLGYNYFKNGRDHLTPIIGAGVFREFKHTGSGLTGRLHAKSETVYYGEIGLLYDHEFNTVFNLGFNIKGLIGGEDSNHGRKWGNPVWGIDASMPFTFRFGYKRHWDFRIEPFSTYMHGDRMNTEFYGYRTTIGYRF